MRTVPIALAALCGVLLSSCGGDCEEPKLLGCDNRITVRVRDASGASLQSFRGTVTIDGESVEVLCPSTPSRFDRECSAGAVSVETPTMPYLLPATIEVSLVSEDGAKSFSGTVSVVDREMLREANEASCYPGCEAGAAEVVLE